MNLLTLVVLDAHKLHDAADDAGRVGDQLFIHYNKWIDMMFLEPLRPIEVLRVQEN